MTNVAEPARRTRSAMVRRIGRTFSAQIYNQIVVLAVQIVQVPLLLSAWGTERYGGWLVLYAIPSYLTLSDFGFTMVAKNSMVAHAASAEYNSVLRVYHSVFALLLVTTGALAIACVAGIETTTLTKLLNLGSLSEEAAKETLLFLLGSVLINQFLLLVAAGVRASGRPAAEVMWGATARLFELLGLLIAAIMSNRVELAALAVFSVRAASAIAIWFWLRCVSPNIMLGLREARISEIKRMIQPSFSYMFLGLAQALAIQGPILLLGIFRPPQEAVLFSASRTLARVGTSAANLVNFSLTPEYSHLHGARNEADFSRLFRMHLLIGLLGIAAYCVALWALGPWIMTIWTHGKLEVVYPFFALLNMAVAAEMYWSLRLTPIAAINRHTRLSYAFVALTAVCAVATWLCTPWAGVTGIAVALLALHGAMSLLTSFAKF